MLLELSDFRVIPWHIFKAGDIVNVGYHRTNAVIVWVEDKKARLWWLDNAGQEGYPREVAISLLSHRRG